jgi:hypothetical protein
MLALSSYWVALVPSPVLCSYLLLTLGWSQLFRGNRLNLHCPKSLAVPVTSVLWTGCLLNLNVSTGSNRNLNVSTESTDLVLHPKPGAWIQTVSFELNVLCIELLGLTSWIELLAAGSRRTTSRFDSVNRAISVAIPVP